jgi:spermidine synthase
MGGKHAVERDAGAPAPASGLGRAAAVVAPLVFGSGMCALVYQTAWQREFRLLFGASTAATAAVVAVFMGGLGLGAFLLGPRADRHARPLRFYAALEALSALAALATPALVALARRAYLALGGTETLGDTGGTALRLVLAALVVLLPTFLAGGTLGAAARAIEGGPGARRRGTAVLYGVSTLGAVAGCLLSTFWLFESLGTRRTLWLAAGVNLGIAGLALVASRRLPAPEGDHAAPAPVAAGAPAWFVLGAAAVTGFAFLLMELVWYRLLGPILGGTVYTFGLVLAVALGGVGAGGLAYALVFRRRVPTLGAFSTACLLQAAALAVPYALGDSLALSAAALRPPAGATLVQYVPGWLAVTAIVVLPAALVAGVQFPLLVALLGAGRERLARHVGRAYLWNTGGGIAGALGGGFGLLPLLTAPGCWAAVALLLAALSIASALVARRGGRAVAGRVVLSVLVASLLGLADGPTAVWRHGSIGVGRSGVPLAGDANALQAWVNDLRRSIAWEREGVESSVAVQQIAALSFVVNGKVDGNARNDAPTQVMGGLLGALLHPGAKRSLVIGLGTGSTAGWLASVPGMETTDVVELEPAVLEVARLCAPVNRSALDNPRVHLRIGDAREALTAGRSRYDLVFSEPSNPYRAGVAGLFTREFYQAAAARLDEDGVFLQWVQAYDVDDWTVGTVVATLGSVFPEVAVWHVHQADLLLVGSKGPRPLDADALRARMRSAPFAEALVHAWRAEALEDVLARFVAGPAQVRRMSAGHPQNTDDRNRVEFAFARSLSRSQLFDVARLRRDAAAAGAGRPDIAGDVDWARVARQRVAIQVLGGSAPVAAADAPADERSRVAAYAQYLGGDLAAAARTFQEQPAEAQGLVETTLLAEGLAEQGDPRAVPYIKALGERQPTEAGAATARLALRLEQQDVALQALLAALAGYRTDPWASQVAMSHALSLADEMSLRYPQTVPLLFEALRQPFAVASLEEPRRLILLSVASHGGTYKCDEVLAPFEPHVPWREDVLKYRLACYQPARHPRNVDARADLERFRRQAKTAVPAPPATSLPGR